MEDVQAYFMAYLFIWICHSSPSITGRLVWTSRSGSMSNGSLTCYVSLGSFCFVSQYIFAFESFWVISGFCHSGCSILDSLLYVGLLSSFFYSALYVNRDYFFIGRWWYFVLCILSSQASLPRLLHITLVSCSFVIFSLVFVSRLICIHFHLETFQLRLCNLNHKMVSHCHVHNSIKDFFSHVSRMNIEFRLHK